MPMEFYPIIFGMFPWIYLLSHRKRFVVFFNTKQSKSRMYSPFSTQKTITHLILILWHLHHLGRARSTFRSIRAGVPLFFSHLITVGRETPNILSSPRKLLRSS